MPSVLLPADLIRDACLFARLDDPDQAVAHILRSYAQAVHDLRTARFRLTHIDDERQALYDRLEALQGLCRQILEL